jgi:hypothetical protein
MPFDEQASDVTLVPTRAMEPLQQHQVSRYAHAVDESLEA